MRIKHAKPGRPKEIDEGRVVSVYLPESLIGSLNQAALKESVAQNRMITVSTYMRNLLQKAMEHTEVI